MENNNVQNDKGFTVRLLIVEDTRTERESWENIIEVHNAQSEQLGFEIIAEYAESQEKAFGLIAIHDYDAAVVDINLQRGEGSVPNADGNSVVRNLLDSELAVVAVFTGEAPQVDTPEWAKPFVRTFQKGADDDEHSGSAAVMDWLIKQMPMVRSIRLAAANIRSEMVQLFTRSIWPRWSEWTNADRDKSDPSLELALSRHLASHIHAVMLEGGGQVAHPEEWYFIPPIRDGIRTGDLVRTENGSIAVVITPRCDLANDGKVGHIQLAMCEDANDQWNGLCEPVRKAAEALNSARGEQAVDAASKKLKRARDEVAKFTRNPKSNTHFLPSVKLNDGTRIGPFLVQFDDIVSLSWADEGALKHIRENRLASITAEFLPSLVERLGAFFSRIGTPNYAHTE